MPALLSVPPSIVDLSFHREQVAARRLALRSGMPFELALAQILRENASELGLEELLHQRREHFLKHAEHKEQSRKASQERHLSKLKNKAWPADHWCAWFDGSATPNPGRCAIGGLLRAPDGRRWEVSRVVGHGNSSTAEYLALIAVLELAITHAAIAPIVFGDSKGVIDDVIALTDAQALGLAEFREKAQVLMQQIPNLKLQWIPRHRNAEADALALTALSKSSTSTIENNALLHESHDLA